MATKKRKEDTECRVFNEKWGEKYFFVEADNDTANCLIRSESIAVWRKYRGDVGPIQQICGFAVYNIYLLSYFSQTYYDCKQH